MKKRVGSWMLITVFLLACNNSGKDSVEKADAANQANRDTGINQKTIVIDEQSAAFLVRVANENMTEVDMAALATQKAKFQPVKDFGSKLLHDHSALHDRVKALSTVKNIILPETISEDKQKEIEALKKKDDIHFDKDYILGTIKRHEESIDLFEKALTEVKDPDINSLADKTLPQLRLQLDSARTLKKSLRY